MGNIWVMWVITLNQLQSSSVIRNRQERLSCFGDFFSFPRAITERGKSSQSCCGARFLSSSPTKDVPFASFWLGAAILDFTHTPNLGPRFYPLPATKRSPFFLYQEDNQSTIFPEGEATIFFHLSPQYTLSYSRESTGNYSLLISA